MTNVHRQTIWRIKKQYVEEGLDSALKKGKREGRGPPLNSGSLSRFTSHEYEAIGESLGRGAVTDSWNSVLGYDFQLEPVLCTQLGITGQINEHP